MGVGAIYIKVSRGDGTALLSPAPDGLDRADESDAGTDAGGQATPRDEGRLTRASGPFDSDIWIVEVEDRQGRHSWKSGWRD